MTTAPATVALDITVDVPVEHAFATFTERFDDIKPKEHNLLAVPIERTVLEPRVGGTIHDIGTDGSTCTWSRVLAFEPPRRIVFSWDIGPTWQVETDPDRCSEVEVTFTPLGEARTRVDLEHRHLDRHGDGWEGVRSGVASGWPTYLDRFQQLTVDKVS